jgi:hypothetical protein
LWLVEEVQNCAVNGRRYGAIVGTSSQCPLNPVICVVNKSYMSPITVRGRAGKEEDDVHLQDDIRLQEST